jgi:GAF domain-containing protein
VSVEDALADARTLDHPKREALRAYCGVPLLRSDGTLFGTVCHYDERPHPVDPATVVALAQLAARLTRELPLARA